MCKLWEPIWCRYVVNIILINRTLVYIIIRNKLSHQGLSWVGAVKVWLDLSFLLEFAASALWSWQGLHLLEKLINDCDPAVICLCLGMFWGRSVVLSHQDLTFSLGMCFCPTLHFTSDKFRQKPKLDKLNFKLVIIKIIIKSKELLKSW